LAPNRSTDEGSTVTAEEQAMGFSIAFSIFISALLLMSSSEQVRIEESSKNVNP